MKEPRPARRPMRADAQRNHASLLNAARGAVAKQGADIVLEDIARSAGVAIGTLYRHFPTRQDLLEAVFLDETKGLLAQAEELVGAPDAFDALISWLRLQMDFAGLGRSMGAAILASKQVEGTRIYAATKAMHGAGNALMRRAQAAGQIRADVQLVDVMRLVYGIAMVNDRVADAAGANRMLDLVIAGISTTPSRG